MLVGLFFGGGDRCAYTPPSDPTSKWDILSLFDLGCCRGTMGKINRIRCHSHLALYSLIYL